MLTANGRFGIASWNPPATNPFFAVALGAIAECGTLDVGLPAGPDMFLWADDDICRELLSASGFGAHTRAQVELISESSDGTATVLEVLQDAGVRSRALYRAQTEQAKAAIVAKITEMLAPMESDGAWRIPATAFVLSAVRM